MTKTTFQIAALLIALAPAAALAESALPDPAVPGSGYRIPAVTRTSIQPLAANQTDLSVPGDGYRIAAAPRVSPQPLAADPADTSVPGAGYGIVDTAH